jgi:hypothetical protein
MADGVLTLGPPCGGDDTTTLQGAVNAVRVAGGGVIRSDAGATYRFGGTLNLDDVRHLTIDGQQSQWIYTGTQADAIRMASAVQVTCKQVRFSTTAPTFTGHVINTGWSAAQCDPSHLTFDGCEFSGPGTARAALRLDRAIITTIRECQFTGTAIGILGQDGSYSNVVRVRDSAFYGLGFCAIYNPGESWTADGNCFEPLASGRAGAVSQDVLLAPRALRITANWFGDVTTPGGTWIAAHALGLTVDGNFFGTAGSGPTDVCLRIFGSHGVSIVGNHNEIAAVLRGRAGDGTQLRGHARHEQRGCRHRDRPAVRRRPAVAEQRRTGRRLVNGAHEQ